MNYKDILKSDYFNETYKKIEEMKKDFPVNHGFVHINNVIKNAKRLSKTFDLSSHEESLLLVACTLHDIGYLDGREDHAFNGSLLAKKYLSDNGVEFRDIEVICDAIKNHGGKKISDLYNPVSMCLTIADKLDFISSRYNKDMLDEEKSKIFPCILDTYIIVNEEIVLNVVINNEFSYFLFENSSYYRKLMEFMNLVSDFIGKKYKIKYICE